MEFDDEAYTEIDRFAKELGIDWFASSWDIPSLEFIERFNPPAHKLPSALLTDLELLRAYRATGKPLIVSTGMSTLNEIKSALEIIGEENLILCHTTSSYPCPPEELNLRMIQTLRDMTSLCPIGYSGHEVGLVPSAVAVALGACLVSATSRLTAPCGVQTKAPRWSRKGLPAWLSTSASRSVRWVMALSAFMTASCLH